MPCPHFKISIRQRSKRQSAVAGAAYQSGEKLFSEYDRKTKNYQYKAPEVVCAEILLPPNAPPEFADRQTLWNAAEGAEQQWNAQLSRGIIMAIPRELPRETWAGFVRDYCREQFVKKGMCVDFAIHDKSDGNPHAHVMLTMRGLDENGRWLPKAHKVCDLDENGKRIVLPSGEYKSHKENVVDWNDRKYAELWRQAWADAANRCLESSGCPERLDLRSYARQGKDIVPTVHLGPAVAHMEAKGIRTDIGNFNREIAAFNTLRAGVGRSIATLKRWLADIRERLAVQEPPREPDLREILTQYLSIRKEERSDWSRGAQRNCGIVDLKKVAAAVVWLDNNHISTAAELEARVDRDAALKAEIGKRNARRHELNGLLRHEENLEKYRPVQIEYSKLGWKGAKEKFAEKHRDELAAYTAAVRFLKAHGDGDRAAWEKELAELEAESRSDAAQLQALNAELNEMKGIRFCVNKVLAVNGQTQSGPTKVKEKQAER